MFKRIISSIFVFLILLQTIQAGPPFTAADLLIVDGKVYHLSLKPEDLAPNIILVGDPDRTPFLADYCLKRTDRIDVSHRGLRTITGETEGGLRVSIVTSGMGTPSLEIVINELIILNEIDLETRMPRGTPLHSRLNIIRLGTSGGLQASTKLGTPIISAFAIGLDNTGLFYTPSKFDTASLELAELCKDSIAAAIPTESTFAHKICPYAAAATPEVVRALYEASLEEGVEAKVGITASNAGFFANQGRDIVGIPLSVPDIDEILSRILFHELRVENMEMEASFMFHFVHALNCRASQPDSLKYYVGAVCPAVANRRLDTFDGHYEENILTSLHIILRAFEKLNSPEE